MTYDATDCQDAFDELRPHVQKLVERFGEAQAYTIMTDLAHMLCREGARKAPVRLGRFLFVPPQRSPHFKYLPVTNNN